MTRPLPGGDAAPRHQVYLHAGHLHVADEPTAVTTILGSCVAVCLWDPVRRAGGINHYLLPYRAPGGESSPRFGNVAIAGLLDGLLALGCRKANLRARVFGGACVIEAFRNGAGHLGTKNVEVAREMLAAQGIPIVEEDVGGTQGRKIVFHLDDGTALVRFIQKGP